MSEQQDIIKRDSAGRFLKGNPGGPGNPNSKRVARLRQTLLKAVTPDDMREVVMEMLNKAKCGDMVAAKLLLEYTIGKPKDTVELEATGVSLTYIIKEATNPKKRRTDAHDDD